MRCSLPMALLLCLAFGVGLAGEADPVFDFEKLIATPLNARVLKSSEADGIVTEEVVFHSETDGEKSVDIFAFFCYPKGAEKLPAFVWNQSGLYPADTYFTTLGANRGYAALCIDFPIPGYRSTGGYPINSGLTLGDDPKKAPIYHGAVALLKAVSFLESRKEVDKDRIGMAGSSWGGFYTTLMIGLDPRLRVGSAMFGTGSLQLGASWWDSGGASAQYDAAFRERWRITLDPAWRLPSKKTPIAWFTGTNDDFFWMPALMKSHEMAAGPKHLTLLPNWNHGLTPTIDEQVLAWLDVFLKGAPAFDQVSELKVEKRRAKLVALWQFSGPRKVVSADLILSCGDAGNWISRCWQTLPAKIDGTTCSVELPRAAMPYFIGGAVVDGQGYRYSTPLVRVDPAAYGVADPHASPDCDGCFEWGGFEKDGISFVNGLGFMSPTVSSDARDGKQSAVLKGQATLKWILFTAGVPHCFSAWVKADREVSVKLQLVDSYDGKVQTSERDYTIGKRWTKIEMDFLPPVALCPKLSAVFTVPEGATVVIDDVSFRPVK